MSGARQWNQDSVYQAMENRPDKTGNGDGTVPDYRPCDSRNRGAGWENLKCEMRKKWEYLKC